MIPIKLAGSWLGWYLLVVGICSAQAPLPNEPALREKLAQLSTPVPPPEVPPVPATKGEQTDYFAKVGPLWGDYWQKESPRLLALGAVCEGLLNLNPKVPDALALEYKMAESYSRLLNGGNGADQAQAEEQVTAMLAWPDLPAEVAEYLYAVQLNEIAILAPGGSFDAIAPVPREPGQIASCIQEAVDKFAKRYPRSEELGELCFDAVKWLTPGHSRAQNVPPTLLEKYLREAAELGDEEVRDDVAKVRFRTEAIGHDAPRVAFTAVDGREVNLTALKGKVVILDFWAAWFAPSLDPLPGLRALYDTGHAQGLEVIGISLDVAREKLEAVVKSQALPWPQSFDGKGWDTPLAEQLGVRQLPDVWVISRNGQVVAINPDDLAAVVGEQLSGAVVTPTPAAATTP